MVRYPGQLGRILRTLVLLGVCLVENKLGDPLEPQWSNISQRLKHPQRAHRKLDTNVAVAPKISDEALLKLKDLYNECIDGAHVCMGLPDGCIRTFLDQQNTDKPETCSVMLSWSVKSKTNDYRLNGNPQSHNGYVAMGFSDDPKMGADSVVGCYGGGTAPVIARFQNAKGSKYNQAHAVPKLGIQNERTSHVDGFFFCDFEQTDHSIPDILNVNITNTKFYILLARGASGSAGALAAHSYGPTDISPSPEKLDITYTGIVGETPSSSAAVVVTSTFDLLCLLALMQLIL